MGDIEDWRLVGEIVHKILRSYSTRIKPGMKLLDICERVEQEIRRYGARPAFPTNIGINSVAAHYTAAPLDNHIVPNNAVVKLDIGAITQSGAIADASITIRIGGNKLIDDAIKKAKEVLDEAISFVRAGIRVGEIGGIIWRAAHRKGLGILVDLTGHSIERWTLHGGITIPNVPKRFTPRLKENMIIAIEPFFIISDEDSITVPDHSAVNIYSVVKTGRNPILKKLYNRFRSLPFSLRWIRPRDGDIRGFVRRMHNFLLEKSYEGYVRVYPTLVEQKKRWVIQFEHTVLVKTNSAEVLT